MPVTGVSSVVGMLSTAGVPPLAGFWSKLLIVMALWQAGHHAYAWVAVLMSVVTLAYMLVLQRKVFFGPTAAAVAEVREAPVMLVAPAVLLAAVTTAVGLLFPLVASVLGLGLGGW
jgi:NADH:ubiquinone oxidoreductase subunit 5 (subunit L)/multisubunit Na+/H+ antiporter MnhA subunit